MTLDEFLGHFDRRVRAGSGFNVPCPGPSHAHGDRNPSLTVRMGDKGIVLHCKAGCDNAAILAAKGLKFSDLFTEPPQTSSPRKQTAPLTIADVAVAKGLPEAVLIELGWQNERRGIRIPYRDAAGQMSRRIHIRRALEKSAGGPKFTWDGPGTDGLTPYGEWKLGEARRVKRLVIAEGETDTITCWHAGLPALGVPGASSVGTTVRADHLRDIEHVVIAQDADEAGHDFVRAVHAIVTSVGIPKVTVLSMPDGVKDLNDWYRRCGSVETFRRAFGEAVKNAPLYVPTDQPSGTEAEEPPEAGLVVVNLADVKPEPIDWLWFGRIARGKLTIVAGDPGVGKSMMTTDVAARVTSGQSWPDHPSAPAVADVIFLAAEDGLADTVRPRLDAMGGDARRVHVVTSVRTHRTGDGSLDERGFTLKQDLQMLEALIARTAAALVVIDPVSNYLGDADSYKDAEVRQVLTPLAQLAERTKVAIVLVMHLTKDSKTTSALYRLNASIGFGGVARLVMAVAPDAEDPNGGTPAGARILANIKHNIVSNPPAVPWSFRCTDQGVQWVEPRPDVRPDLIFAGASRAPGESSTEAVDAFLCRVLADGEFHDVKHVEAAAREANIGHDRLYRRRRELCEAKRVGGPGASGHWACRLKPEFREAPAFAGEDDDKECSAPAPKIVGSPLAAILGSTTPVNGEESMGSAKNAASAILGGSALLGGDEGWAEI